MQEQRIHITNNIQDSYLEQKLEVVEQMAEVEKMEEILGKGVQLPAHKDSSY